MISDKRIPWAFAIILLAWAATIFPSVFFPYWAYLDDPGIIWRGSVGFDSPQSYLPNLHSGRFCPAYWFYYSVIFQFSKFHLSGYYFIQSLVFFGIAGLLFLLGNRLAGNLRAGLLASLLFLTASPVAENAYTLGKPEPRILLAMLVAFWLFLVCWEHSQNRFLAWMTWGGIGAMILFSMLTKETTLVLVVFGIAGLGLTFVSRRRNPSLRSDVFHWSGFLLCVLLVIGGIRGLYYSLLPEYALNVYTSYPITLALIWNNLRFYSGQIPDIPILGICASMSCLLVFRRFSALSPRRAVFTASLCLVGWAYFFGMLLWRWPLGYYMLIPAGFFSSAMAVSAFHAKSDTGIPRFVWILAGILLFTRLYSVPYGIYVARAQKAVDRTFTEMMEAYAKRSEPGQRLFVENWPFYVEPVRKSNLLLEGIWGLEGREVQGVRDILDGEKVTQEVVRLHAYEKIPDPETRIPEAGDFVARIFGNREVSWFIRGVSPFASPRREFAFHQLGAQLKLVEEASFQWAGWHGSLRRPIPSYDLFSSGYRLGQVTSPPFFVWKSGRWEDGWMGSEAICRIRMQETAAPYLVKGTAPSTVVPATLRVFQGEIPLAVHRLTEPGPFSIPLVLEAAGELYVELRFAMDRTFVPREAGTGTDDRELSVLLEVKKGAQLKWNDRWTDGWIGKEAVCRVFWPGEGPLTVSFSGTGFSQNSPQTLILWAEDVLKDRKVEIPEGPFSFNLTIQPSSGSPRYVPIHIQSQKTFNPMGIGESEDSRDLAVQISAKRISMNEKMVTGNTSQTP